ncbi:conserved hypothetical protein [Cyanophage NATL2A-133]|uniref:Gp42 n=1 Tax=Cyanophage NATL2A-133 TaxID=445692 RepID=E3SP49_9CAUD|nr:internal virion protein [Cyanophage NATL2A-133]ADP00166.1 conserved hypothetical protein [Cyanophage NATL2A-133]
MYEGNYIKPCTPELALSVGLNLRWEDRREVEQTTGYCAEAVIIQSYFNSAYGQCVYFEVPNGKAAGVAGVTPQNVIWMLCTEASTEYPHTFVREAKRWVDSLPNTYLMNQVDMRNEAHVKLLKLLGFKFIKYHVYNGVPLIEFIKLCASQP